MIRRTSAPVASVFAALLVVLPAAADARKPVDGTSSSLALVLRESADGVPNHGETVTFTVKTSASRPFVELTCRQNGSMVYSASAGFFPDYPWSTDYVLSSLAWPSGGADCAARLYTVDNRARRSVLATLTFTVFP